MSSSLTLHPMYSGRVSHLNPVPLGMAGLAIQLTSGNTHLLLCQYWDHKQTPMPAQLLYGCRGSPTLVLKLMWQVLLPTESSMTPYYIIGFFCLFVLEF